MTYKPTGKPTGRPKKKPPISGERPNLTVKMWEGLEFELEHLEDFDGPTWGPTLPEVGKAAGVSKQMVQKWRKNPAYVQGLIHLAAKQLAAGLSRPEAITDDAPQPKRPKRTADALLHVELKENWTGPTKSPIDGKTYNDPDAYFKHIQENPDVQWVGDLPHPSKEPKKP